MSDNKLSWKVRLILVGLLPPLVVFLSAIIILAVLSVVVTGRQTWAKCVVRGVGL